MRMALGTQACLVEGLGSSVKSAKQLSPAGNIVLHEPTSPLAPAAVEPNPKDVFATPPLVEGEHYSWAGRSVGVGGAGRRRHNAHLKRPRRWRLSFRIGLLVTHQSARGALGSEPSIGGLVAKLAECGLQAPGETWTQRP